MRLVVLYFVIDLSHGSLGPLSLQSSIWQETGGKMSKICFISPEYLPLSGGTGAYVYYLSKELIKHGNTICILTGYSQGGDVRVNKNLSVRFLKTTKTPIVKSFMFAGIGFQEAEQLSQERRR